MQQPLLALALLATLAGVPATRELDDDPSVRVERFVLEACDPTTGAMRPAGSVLWRRRALQDGMQIELECTFAGEPGQTATRVAHVERLGGLGPRLVWREWGARTGRCLVAEWTPDGKALRTHEWSRDDPPRETHSTCEGAVMPLYLLELARDGQATAGRFSRFDPLTRRLDPVEMRTSYAPASTPPLRTVELARPDGTSAGRYRFRGLVLESFQWQDGALRARRVDAAEYDRASRDAN